MTTSSFKVSVKRSLLIGMLSLGMLFAFDAWDSYRLFRRATRRIRTDEATLELLTNAVTGYIWRAALGYALVGLIVGVTVTLALRFWFSTAPTRGQWWRAGGIIIVVAAVLSGMSQTILYPSLYDGFTFTVWWADNVHPSTIQAVAAVAVVVWSLMALSHWRQQGLGNAARPAGVLVLWLGAMYMLLAPPQPKQAVDNDHLNVVIIGVDGLRPDHLAHFGYDKETAPNITALLEESVAFEQAWTVLARTYGSWTSMMTGLLPINNGIRDNLPEPSKLVPEVPILPLILQEKGYTTTFVTDDSRFSYMVPELGYDNIVQPPPNIQNFAVSLNEPRFRVFAWMLHNPLGFAILPTAAYNQAFPRSFKPDLFVDKAVDTFARGTLSGDPFFYVAHTCVLHAPSTRPWPWHQMYEQNGYKGGNRFRYSQTGTSIIDEDLPKGAKKGAISAQDMRIYDAGIDMADRLVGGIVTQLKESGLWDNTIVILLSDHGEEHWAKTLPYKYHGPNHGYHSYGDGQHKVVLAVRMPDGSMAGKRVSSHVRLTDLAPTVADLLDFEWPGETDGKSIMPLVDQEEEAPREVYIETGFSAPKYWVKGHRRYPFKRLSAKYSIDDKGSVMIKPSFLPHMVAAKDRVMQVGDWKLIWHSVRRGQRVELFNRKEDPANLNDLYHEHPDIADDLLARMDPHLTKDGFKFWFYEEAMALKAEGKRPRSRKRLKKPKK